MSKVSESLMRVAFNTAPLSLIVRFHDGINVTLDKFDIDTKHDIAMFLAQIGHESGNLKFVKENLNYSAEALLRVFKKYFPNEELATQYARNPQKIANRVYANRMGNGSESSGDGWRYCGRGLIQLTGKNNYTQFAKSINKTIDETIEYLETPEGACMSAGFYWKTRNINGKDVLAATKLINGGTHGLEDRKQRFERIISAM